MACSLYIYYKADGNLLPIHKEAATLLADVLQQTGITGRLLQRCEDAHTWMEIYEPVSDIAALREVQAASLSRLPALASLPRHEEYFVELTAASPTDTPA